MLKLISAISTFLVSGLVLAQEAATTATGNAVVHAASNYTDKAMFAMAAAGAITFAAIGGAYAQGKAASRSTRAAPEYPLDRNACRSSRSRASPASRPQPA